MTSGATASEAAPFPVANRAHPAELVGEVLAVTHPAADLVHLALLVRGMRLEAEVGSFFMVRCGEGLAPLLRRPLSAAGIAAHPHGTRLELLVGILGRGTQWLAARRAGDALSVLGPLGRGFRLDVPPPARLLVVLGGTRFAPLLDLTTRPEAAGLAVEPWLVTAPATAEALAARLPASFSRPRVLGLADLEAALAERLSAAVPPARLLAAGPDDLLRLVVGVSRAHAISCEVALEPRMACGYGACFGCTLPLRTPSGAASRARICLEGPVVSAERCLAETFAHEGHA